MLVNLTKSSKQTTATICKIAVEKGFTFICSYDATNVGWTISFRIKSLIPLINSGIMDVYNSAMKNNASRNLA